MRAWSGRWYVTVALAVVSAACASSHASKAIKVEPEAAPEVIESGMKATKEYVIAPGDQLDVVVRRVPEVSRQVIVRPDGNISLVLLGDVPVAGSTFTEVTKKLTDLFSKRLVDPEVTVIGTQVRPAMVYVIGEVVKPAVVTLQQAPTAMHAVALAGGITHAANGRDVAVIRVDKDGYIRAMVVKVPVGGQAGPYVALRNLALQADDVVFVPENGRTQIARFIRDLVVTPVQPLVLATAIAANFRIIQHFD